MNRIPLVAIAAVIVLGSAAGASAQTVKASATTTSETRYIHVDPLDPMATFAARVAARTVDDGTSVVVVNDVSGPIAGNTYTEYREQYIAYLEEYSRYADGKQIAYTDEVGGAIELFVCQADGSNPRKISALGGRCSFPAWSPDGKWIAVQHWENEGTPGNLWVVGVQDGVQKKLGHTGGFPVGRPSWRPR